MAEPAVDTVVPELGKATAIYANQFYEKLVEAATLESIGPDTKVLVFRGKLTDVYDSLKLSSVYYTRIRKIFLKYDCVTYLERGTKAYASVLVLNHPPPPAENLSEDDLTDRPGDATLTALADRVEEAEAALEKMENWHKSLGGLNIVDALRNFEQRLQRLERSIKTGG